jgi:hypothetical protein
MLFHITVLKIMREILLYMTGAQKNMQIIQHAEVDKIDKFQKVLEFIIAQS